MISHERRVQYRAVSRTGRNGDWRVVAVSRIPEPGKRLKRYDMQDLISRLSRKEAFATANTMNRLTNFPLHQPTGGR